MYHYKMEQLSVVTHGQIYFLSSILYKNISTSYYFDISLGFTFIKFQSPRLPASLRDTQYKTEND